MSKRPFYLIILFIFLVAGNIAFGSECLHSKHLDTRYCDNDKDLLADPPIDPSNWIVPKTIKFAYTPVEDHNIYQAIFSDLMKYLEKSIGRPVKYYPTPSNSSEVEAMQIGRLHIAAFATGTTGYAVNLAGFNPMAVIGYPTGYQGYNLMVITHSDSDIFRMIDLKGKKVAHTSTFSNSGNLAARAFFPALGVIPDEDYYTVFSDSHGQSILGVLEKKFDAAPVASDVFGRMIRRGVISRNQFRIIYKSPKFPTSAFGYAHNLHPDLVQKIVGAFHTYRFPPEMKKIFGEADRFYSISYLADWKIVRNIAEATGTNYSKKSFEALVNFENRLE